MNYASSAKPRRSNGLSGLPRGDKGRIGLDIYQRDGRLVYAIVEAAGKDSGLYRSTDRRETWQQLGALNPRPMYYSQIRVDPKDRNRIYMLGSNRGFLVSDDGGRNFRDIFSTVHSEDHALWIDPDDTNHLIVGGDGGVSISWDRGETWMFRDNLPIGQFYEISADMREPYFVCGGLQDNGMWCIPSATRTRNGISNADAYNIGGGDGSTRGSIRRTRTRSTSTRRKAAPAVSTWRRSSARSSRRRRRRSRGVANASAGTGTRRSSSRASIRWSSTPVRTCGSGPTIGA